MSCLLLQVSSVVHEYSVLGGKDGVSSGLRTHFRGEEWDYLKDQWKITLYRLEERRAFTDLVLPLNKEPAWGG